MIINFIEKKDFLKQRKAQLEYELFAKQQEMSLRQQTYELLSRPLMSQEELQNLLGCTLTKPAWTEYAVIKNPYYMPQYCCDDGSSVRPLKTNCVNCGASLKGKHFCDYCGTYNK